MFVVRRNDMARRRIPNYIARKTEWFAIFNWSFLICLLMEALLVVWQLGFIPITLPDITINGVTRNLLTIILACWSGVFVVIFFWKLIVVRCDYVEFYDDYVIVKKGVIFRKSEKKIFPQILSVRTHRNILGYGTVDIDVVGPWDLDLSKRKRPEDLREYLVDHMVNSVAVENIGNNPYIAAMANIF